MIVRTGVLAIVVACSSDAKPEITCEQAGARVRELASPALGDLATSMCRSQAWSPAARTCVAGLRSIERVLACHDTIGASADMFVTAVAGESVVVAKSKLDLPEPVAQHRSVVVEVGESSIAIDGKLLASDDLAPVFRAIVARDRDTQVVIKAARGVTHGRVVAILEQAKAAGLTHLAIGTMP